MGPAGTPRMKLRAPAQADGSAVRCHASADGLQKSRRASRHQPTVPHPHHIETSSLAKRKIRPEVFLRRAGVTGQQAPHSAVDGGQDGRPERSAVGISEPCALGVLGEVGRQRRGPDTCARVFDTMLVFGPSDGKEREVGSSTGLAFGLGEFARGTRGARLAARRRV